VDALFRDAVAAFGTALQSDNYDAVLEAAEEVADAGPEAAAYAQARLRDPDPAVRAVACDVLTFAAEEYDEVHADAATELIAVAEAESDTDVLWSIIRALGATTDGRAAPILIRLARHPDPDIRFRVATALPLVAPTADLRAITATLIELSNDVDDEVRNWATFGLGAQLTVDGFDVRSALWACCFDPSEDVRAEGIRGLARRRDPVAVPFVAQLLVAGDVDSATVQAAAFLADPTLLYGLSIHNPDEPWVFEAQTACDPVRRAYTDAAAWSIFEYVSRAVTDRAVAIACERLEPNIFLSVDEEQWAIVPLLRRANGDPARAAQFLLDDLAGGLSH
jgi:HEAT repeat protein